MGRLLLGSFVCCVAYTSTSTPAEAQYGRYQGQEPQRVSIDELVTASARYNEQPVIVQGRIDYGDPQDQDLDIYELRGESAMRAVRVAVARGGFDDLRFSAGQRAEITGIFFDLQSVMMPEQHPVLRYFPGAFRRDALGFDKQYFIAIMNVAIIEDTESTIAPDDPAETNDIEDPEIDPSGLRIVDLRQLVKTPEPFLGERIVVIGKFRGSNLYGDLSIQDKRTPRDFVIKVADAAIWVTGRRPRGDDFRLNPDRRRDTGEWLRVIGEPWEYEENVYLRAEKIELAEEPDDESLEPVDVSEAEEEDVLGPPPEVIFSLPLDGETIPLASEFQVQFSKPMRATSFHRNVDLLYGDDDGFGNPFPELEVHYDDIARTLSVKPNKPLEPGKELRLILYDGIEDMEGQTLPVQPDAEAIGDGAAVILTFRTARS